MAQNFYTAENLGFPFHYIRELVMIVPATGNRVVSNRRKLVLVLGGTCRHRFEKERAVTLQRGDALVVTSPVTQYYELLPGEDAARLHALVILLDKKCVANTGSEFREYRETSQFIETYFQENAVVKNVMDADFFDAVAQIREEAELQLPGFRWRITALCAAGLVRLARHLRENSAPETSGIPATQRGVFLVSRAKEYLLRHLTYDLTLSDVAQHLQVSNGHLAHTFKRVAGQSLFTYFRHLRLEQAKLKLLNSESNVTEIAAECGFSSTTLFCRNFKNYTGLTPLTYRDAFGAKTEL